MHPTLRAVGQPRSALSRFLDWWAGELSSLLPAPVRSFLAGSRPVIVLAVLESGFSIFEEHGRRVRPLGPPGGGPLTRGDALTRLANAAGSSQSKAIGVRLPASSCYARSVELPANARKDFDSILKLDLARATPFRLQDVYTSHIVDDDSRRAGKVHVLQLVAKRDIVDPILADIEALGRQPAFIDCWRDQLSPGLPVNLLPTDGASRPRVAARLGKALAGLALLLIVSALYLSISAHEKALVGLRAQSSATGSKAAAIGRSIEHFQTALDDLARLQALKLAQPPAVAIIEEVTRRLPDTVWLTDLRIEGDVVDLSGLARSGAELPPLFERSTVLTEATLTAPLTLDPREDKERFGLRLKVLPATARVPVEKGNAR